MFKIFVLVFIFISGTISWEIPGHPQDSELVFVQALWRHGDRNPTDFYPNDPHQNESNWPEGFGQLTKKGKQMHYEVGQFNRKRYDGYLNSTYNPYEIYVEASNVDRTMMSAAANLAGLYPPLDERSKWSDTINWQPIPIHNNRPASQDNVIGVSFKCPKYDELYKAFGSSEEMNKINDENKELYALLTKHTGKEIKNPLDVYYLNDVLLIERNYNKPLPEWTNEIFPKYEQKFKDLSAFALRAFSYTPELQRFKGGPTLKEFIKNMKGRMDGTLDKRLKMHIYSGHDTTIAALFTTLGMYNDILPPYRAMVLVELHKVKDKYFVEFLYRNNTEVEPYKLTMPGCEFSCEMSKFLDLTKSKISDDWDGECGITDGTSKITFLGVIVGALIMAIIIGLVAGVVFYMKSKKRSGGGNRRNENA